MSFAAPLKKKLNRGRPAEPDEPEFDGGAFYVL
jgi:hypothetical protein